MGTVAITRDQQRLNLTQCFKYKVSEKIKAMHRTFYVQLLENRLNLNARKKFLKALGFGQNMLFCKSGALKGCFPSFSFNRI